MAGMRTRKAVFFALFFASTVFFLSKGVWGAGDQGKAPPPPPQVEVQQFFPPDLPCGIQAMAGVADDVILLGGCGGIIRWQPFLNTHSVIMPVAPLEEVLAVAADEDRIAVLGEKGRLIRTYNSEGESLTDYHYPGETYFQDVALVPNGVVASSFFDDHLLYFFGEDDANPIPLIENPRYWPNLSPRYSAFVDVHFTDGKLFAVDLIDSAVYVVDPEDMSVSIVEKEAHPWRREPAKPNEISADENIHYTAEYLAVSSAVHSDRVFVLWVDRSLERGLAQPGDGYMELAVGGLTDKDWRTVVRLEDHERFGGCRHLSIVGESIFFLTMHGHVYAIELADR